MSRKSLLRLVIVIALFLAFFLLGKYTIVGNWFNLNTISETVKNAGAWGYLALISLTVVGCLLQFPAMLFVLAAIFTYGQVEGTILGLISIVMAMVVNFLFVRIIGGKSIAEITNPFIKRMLIRLDSKPISTIIILRLVLWASPVLSSALAMTKLKFHKYVIGSTLGIIVPLAIFSALVYYFQEWFI